MKQVSVPIDWTEEARGDPDAVQLYRTEFICPVCGARCIIVDNDTETAMREVCAHFSYIWQGYAVFDEDSDE